MCYKLHGVWVVIEAVRLNNYVRHYYQLLNNYVQEHNDKNPNNKLTLEERNGKTYMNNNDLINWLKVNEFTRPDLYARQYTAFRAVPKPANGNADISATLMDQFLARLVPLEAARKRLEKQQEMEYEAERQKALETFRKMEAARSEMVAEFEAGRTENESLSSEFERALKICMRNPDYKRKYEEFLAHIEKLSKEKAEKHIFH